MKNIIWAIASSLIIFSGVYFSFSLKFPQFKFKKMFKFNKSSFKTLMLTLGGRIGVGSISGIALCIYYGGVGSLFWMWLFSIVGASTTMAETVLGLVYKKENGGPSYYLKYGLNNEYLGIIYALLIVVSYIGGFLSIQTNTIVSSLKSFLSINEVFIGLILVIMIGLIIFGGINSISNFLSKVVPVMTLLYLLLGLIVIFKNINNIFDIFISIFRDAFKLKPFFSGFIYKFILGLQRGIFSNESGIGTSVIASSTVDSKDYVREGYIQILGVYITSIIICGATAIIVMYSDYMNNIYSNMNGIEIVQYAFSYHFKEYGNIILFIFIFLFSLSTVLTGYYYGEVSYKYLFKNGSLVLLKIVTLVVLFLGCVIDSGVIWNVIDILVGLMAILNIYALLKLKEVVKNNVT